MSNWKIDPNTDKQWISVISGLHNLIYYKKDVITSLPEFESAKDEGIKNLSGVGPARKLEVTYKGTSYTLYIHFYNRDNGNCLAVTNGETGKNLIQLVIDNYLEKTPFGARLWHDGVITGVTNLNSEKLLNYVKEKSPALVKNESGYGDYIEFGYINEKEQLSFSNSKILKLFSNLLLFSILRHEIKKEFKSDEQNSSMDDFESKYNIYFGKISKTKNPQQFIEGFYETQYPEMYNGIDVNDYSYIIADGKIQLWRAKKWEKDGNKLLFDIINPDLNINTKDLTSLKFLQLNTQFVVLTIRQSPNAFYKLEMVKEFTEEMLVDPETYINDNNFRDIVVNKTKPTNSEFSEDINLYYENNNLKLVRPTFFSSEFFYEFVDNLNKAGLGRKNKDKVLNLIKSISKYPKTFNRQELSILNLYDSFGVQYDADNEVHVDNNHDNNLNMDHPLNQILFGPPGTGKTYHSVSEAIKIVDSEFYAENYLNREKLQERFNDLLIKDWSKPNGQIAFCTFHQSFSYEDFVEGIKPKATDNKQVYYEIEDGIFKSLSRHADANNNAQTLAKENLVAFSQEEFNQAVFYKISLGDSTKEYGKQVYDYCISNNVISIGFGEDIDFTQKTEEEINQMVTQNLLDTHAAQSINYFKSYLKVGNYVVVSNGNSYIRALGRVTGEYEFEEESEIGFNHFRKVEWIFSNVDIPVNEFYQSNLMQKTIYKLKKEFIIPTFFVTAEKKAEVKPEKKNFVIIIDEINRGNVSSIFGELITLIEPSKRAGCPEELSVVLPYSKKQFTVPSNVFIVGTMNTADRSIESLDTALRRRFSFNEMSPQSSIIKLEGKSKGIVDGIDIVTLLDKMNERIEKLIDKDHKIGHSYFINVSTKEHLQHAFRDKVIPLLEEYFFGDFGKIGLVLGQSFIKKESDEFEFARFTDYDSQTEQDLKQRTIYKIKPQSEWDFKSIYEVR